MTNEFTAHAERGDGWWVVQLEEDPGLVTQTRRLDQIQDMVRDALTLFPELTDSPETAQIRIVVDPPIPCAQQAMAANAKAKQAQQEATALMVAAAKHLASEGLPYRDIGVLLGVSFQRAQKLATTT